MDNAVIENSAPRKSAPPVARGARAWDFLFALSIPAYFGYASAAVTRGSLPHPVLVELVPVLWVLTRHKLLLRLGHHSRIAAVATVILSTLGVGVCSFPVLSGTPLEQIRYEMSLSLGTLWGSFPVTSLLCGLLVLGPCHLGGVALCSAFEVSTARRAQVHDLYFGIAAVVAHLTLVRYAGGPLSL